MHCSAVAFIIYASFLLHFELQLWWWWGAEAHFAPPVSFEALLSACGDRVTQIPRGAPAVPCFHSPCLAHLTPARQCYFLSLLVRAPASSGLIQLALSSSMCAWVWGEYKWNNSGMKGQTGVFNNTHQQEGLEGGEKAHRHRRLLVEPEKPWSQVNSRGIEKPHGTKVRGWLLPGYEQKEKREWEQMALNYSPLIVCASVGSNWDWLLIWRWNCVFYNRYTENQITKKQTHNSGNSWKQRRLVGVCLC